MITLKRLEQQALITIGESGLLTGAPRSATVLAKTKVTTLSLHKRRVEQLMKSDPATIHLAIPQRHVDGAR